MELVQQDLVHLIGSRTHRMKLLVNDFGESMTWDQVDAVATKLQSLTSSQIDDYWYRCGIICAEKGFNKAVPEKVARYIRSNYGYAKMHVQGLFLDAQKSDVLSVL